MPGALDGAMRSVAKSLHQTFGKSVTATIRGEAIYNPTTGVAAVDETGYSVVGVVGRFRQSELQGDIEASDIKLTVAAKGNPDMTTADAVTMEDRDYEVVAVMPVYSGAQIAYYSLALRA